MPLEPSFLVGVARTLVDRATELHLNLRLIGGVAVRMQCPRMMENGLVRPLTRNDIDFIADARHVASLNSMMLNSACLLKRVEVYRGGEHRYYEYHSHRGTRLGIDIYFGHLRFNHFIPGPYFVGSEKYTIPLTQLLLSKLAILEFREADMRDVEAILAEHEIGSDSGAETIGRRSLMVSWCIGCSAWGLATTCKQNLANIRKDLDALSLLKKPTSEVVTRRLDELEALALRCPKSWCWRARAAIGTRVSWYDPVSPEAEAGMLIRDNYTDPNDQGATQ